MSDPKEIWLQPECCADPSDGRLWCEQDAPEDCEDGKPRVRYVLAAEVERLQARLVDFAATNKVLADELEQSLARLAEATTVETNLHKRINEWSAHCEGVEARLAERDALLKHADYWLDPCGYETTAQGAEIISAIKREIHAALAAGEGR